jgi:hypothetical protein
MPVDEQYLQGKAITYHSLAGMLPWVLETTDFVVACSVYPRCASVV